MASVGALVDWYAQNVPGYIDAVHADNEPLYEPPTKIHGALSALLAPLGSNGSLMVLAILILSFSAFSSVKA